MFTFYALGKFKRAQTMNFTWNFHVMRQVNGQARTVKFKAKISSTSFLSRPPSSTSTKP
jgi:hypothetical protein